MPNRQQSPSSMALNLTVYLYCSITSGSTYISPLLPERRLYLVLYNLVVTLKLDGCIKCVKIYQGSRYPFDQVLTLISLNGSDAKSAVAKPIYVSFEVSSFDLKFQIRFHYFHLVYNGI